MVVEIAFNPENPSFRALNALLGETLIGPLGLLVAGFMFMPNENKHRNWNKILTWKELFLLFVIVYFLKNLALYANLDVIPGALGILQVLLFIFAVISLLKALIERSGASERPLAVTNLKMVKISYSPVLIFGSGFFIGAAVMYMSIGYAVPRVEKQVTPNSIDLSYEKYLESKNSTDSEISNTPVNNRFLEAKNQEK